jgi:hypothetical protein
MLASNKTLAIDGCHIFNRKAGSRSPTVVIPLFPNYGLDVKRIELED